VCPPGGLPVRSHRGVWCEQSSRLARSKPDQLGQPAAGLAGEPGRPAGAVAAGLLAGRPLRRPRLPALEDVPPERSAQRGSGPRPRCRCSGGAARRASCLPEQRSELHRPLARAAPLARGADPLDPGLSRELGRVRASGYLWPGRRHRDGSPRPLRLRGAAPLGQGIPVHLTDDPYGSRVPRRCGELLADQPGAAHRAGNAGRYPARHPGAAPGRAGRARRRPRLLTERLAGDLLRQGDDLAARPGAAGTLGRRADPGGVHPPAEARLPVAYRAAVLYRADRRCRARPALWPAAVGRAVRAAHPRGTGPVGHLPARLARAPGAGAARLPGWLAARGRAARLGCRPGTAADGAAGFAHRSYGPASTIRAGISAPTG
jgi:hypothetical protein